MVGTAGRRAFAALAAVVFLAVVLAAAGCGEGQVTFMSFTGKGSESVETMKPIIKNLKKKYSDDVVFRDIDMDDPASKAEVDKFHVTMNPTFIVLNSKGQVKETFMGAAQEEMLVRAIESYIPRKGDTPGTTPAAPSYPSAPYQPSPDGVETVPLNPAPGTAP